MGCTHQIRNSGLLPTSTQYTLPAFGQVQHTIPREIIGQEIPLVHSRPETPFLMSMSSPQAFEATIPPECAWALSSTSGIDEAARSQAHGELEKALYGGSQIVVTGMRQIALDAFAEVGARFWHAA